MELLQQAVSSVTDDGIPQLARTMGQETIDMLSKAKMRYVPLYIQHRLHSLHSILAVTAAM